MQDIYLSVIIPFKNEEGNLPKLNKQLVKELSKLAHKTEVVYIDDGSTDNSLSIIKKEISQNKSEMVSFVLISLRRNMGQTAAVTAGINNSGGKLVSFLDADLQNDPSDISRFLEKINEGYDAVFGWRKDRKDVGLRSIFSRVANRIINMIFNYPYHDVGCSARVVKREYLENLELYGELHRIMPVLIYLKGAKVGEIVVKHNQRRSGKSKYGFERIIKTLIDIITIKFLSTYGTRPAYVFGSMGLGSLFLGSIALLSSIYKKLFLGVFIHRDPLFLIAIFFAFVGIQFISMGLLAELQIRTYYGSQNKETYEIKSKDKF